MKVRCIRLFDSAGKLQEKSTWLTIGKVYHVFEVVHERGRWLLRIMADEPNGLALFQLEQFEIVTPKIPATWTISWGKDGFFELAPQQWCHTGFWESYYDRDPDTVRIFEEERRKIIEADP